jgi:hypothetical protein
VFKAWGMTERNGAEIQITTHAFRHWLNTIAQLRGMSELDIAKWSGRDVSQNKAYNHVSPEERVAQIRDALDDGNAIGPMFEAAKLEGVRQPVDRRDFIDAQIGSALTTDCGICVHDYSLLPCSHHGDCLGCSENIFVKGDLKHSERVSMRLSLTQKQLSDAQHSIDKEGVGVDRWIEAHQTSVDRMSQMMAIHSDPEVPDGTIVSLSKGIRDSEIAMALRDRVEHGADVGVDGFLTSEPKLRNVLSEMWED